ncbi:phycobiliprotein lyase [Pseudanabaena sp. FACHB-1277]|uniref:Chromophore lyase CpcS/CpeS n=1 Tax=Pseudanabaena cinerea FACHB-1277 TaxID=2949581 RepID=A0A926UUE4_9CYAN|nr:phycobiliprotein lyase [Pseudanabaena cinerea]MBD2150220.1 phycobiliprotein lyase [Pseudanabaena cinerea FACHB-1277]
MDIREFVAGSIGHWRSQRSAHHLAFGHFEAVQSEIDITDLALDAPEVVALCQAYSIDPKEAIAPFRMSWVGQSDWEDSEEIKGNCVLVPIPDPERPNCGKLLRERGYAEEVAAIGEYHITEDNTFVLVTNYDRASAEEKIWFVNPNVRCRVSLIKTSAGTGVITASFSSEIRQSSQSA